MKTLKRTVAAAAALVAAAFAGAPAPSLAEDVKLIAVVHGQASDPWWSIVKRGLAEGAETNGVDVEYRAPETFDMVAMAQLIDAAVNQEPDGIIVSIPDADALGPSIEKAVEAGIPVVSINSGSDVYQKLGALVHVGQEEYTAGLAAGKALKAAGGSKALCINHEVGNVALDTRCEGLAKGFGGEVVVLPTTNDPSEVKAKVKAALDSDETIDTVLGLSATLAGKQIVAAVDELGRGGEIKIGSFDLSGDYLEAVRDGQALFAIDQQPYLQGFLPVQFLALNARYGLMPATAVGSGPNLITKDKAAQVIDLASKGIR